MNEYGVHEAQYAALVADLEAAGLGVGAPVTELRLVRAAGSGVEIYSLLIRMDEAAEATVGVEGLVALSDGAFGTDDRAGGRTRRGGRASTSQAERSASSSSSGSPRWTATFS